MGHPPKNGFLFGFPLNQPQPPAPPQGLYFTSVTLTTVGYGDMTPKTSEGQLATTLLVLTGGQDHGIRWVFLKELDPLNMVGSFLMPF